MKFGPPWGGTENRAEKLWSRLGRYAVFQLKGWPGTELNRRRQPFQGCALPFQAPNYSESERGWYSDTCVSASGVQPALTQAVLNHPATGATLAPQMPVSNVTHDLRTVMDLG